MPATDQYWRPLNTLHKVSAVSALILLGATLLMMAADHRDEWREYQVQADELKVAQINNQLSEIQTAEYKSKLAQLQDAEQSALSDVQQRVGEIARVQATIDQLRGEAEFLKRETKFTGAERDVSRANYDLAVRDEKSGDVLAALKSKFHALQATVDEMSLTLKEKDAALVDAKGQLATQTSALDAVAVELKELQGDADLLEKSLATIAPKGGLEKFKRWLMLQPIVDGFNSPHGIKQEWLPHMPITLGMATTARFDRCRTCHVNIDDFGAGDVPTFPHGEFADGEYPHPFSAHPRPDVYLTSTSPHPMPVFGCTVCHDGDGSGTSFQNAEHTPDHPAMAEHWSDDHHWHSNHYWEYPMQPDRFIESTCVKCHHSMVELGVNKQYGATAPKVYEGYSLIAEYGCFGCHEINGFNGSEPIGPDLRLEPQTPEEFAKYAADPNQIPGRMRKVGPSLRHVASKTTAEFLAYWTEIPSRFRPTTKMPQFFHLSNQQDADAERYQPVQIAAMAAYFIEKSQPFDLDKPREGYTPNAERGQQLFSEKGCLACHQYGDDAFAGNEATFGPDLSRVHEKIKPGIEGFHWLYTWVREPSRHHVRTKMPDLFLDPTGDPDGEGETYVDPAADIAAFLLKGDPNNAGRGQFPDAPQLGDVAALDELVSILSGIGDDDPRFAQMMAERAFPMKRELIKGDEIELARRDDDPASISEEEWQHRKTVYVGRRSISFYGCYGCHDIPEFEAARPTGTALQDWGRKETSKLAFEHIAEFLHHHGDQYGSPAMAMAKVDDGHGHADEGELLPERAEAAVKRQYNNGDAEADDLAAAFFFESMHHHGRPGFIWQKLRQPRSYDYKKTETKRYDERLRMPKFPFSEAEIESIATFVLGLVAEPPPSEYVYRAEGAKADIIEGERLLAKYNCAGCHILELPEIAYKTSLDDVVESELGPADYQHALELLMQLKPPQDGLDRDPLGDPIVTAEGENIVRFKGMLFAAPDPDDDPEDQEYSYDLWETLQVGEKTLYPSSKMLVPALSLVEQKPARGGDFAEWLVPHLMKTTTKGNRFMAWQASPPPLYQEGIKVQTPWLYKFLKNPEQLRFTTVLRMPKFNLDDDEARSLANYFAAIEEAAYPYQSIPQQQPPYLDAHQAEFAQAHPAAGEDYLGASWKVLNGPLCSKCHAVGGNEYKSTDPKKDIRGPNLDRVAKRLRPDWAQLWLYKPNWIAPYTSMPANFPANQKQLPEMFDGDGGKQTIAVRDALMNYSRLMEAHGSIAYRPAGSEQPPQAGAGGK